MYHTTCPRTAAAIGRSLVLAHRRTIWVGITYRTQGRRLGTLVSILARRASMRSATPPAAALAQVATRTRCAHTWGSLSVRTASRRAAGLVASTSCYALAAFSSRFGYWAPYPGCAAAGQWSPVQAWPQSAPLAICRFCQSAIIRGSRCACLVPAHV